MGTLFVLMVLYEGNPSIIGGSPNRDKMQSLIWRCLLLASKRCQWIVGEKTPWLLCSVIVIFKSIHFRPSSCHNATDITMTIELRMRLYLFLKSYSKVMYLNSIQRLHFEHTEIIHTRYYIFRFILSNIHSGYNPLFIVGSIMTVERTPSIWKFRLIIWAS